MRPPVLFLGGVHLVKKMRDLFVHLGNYLLACVFRAEELQYPKGMRPPLCFLLGSLGEENVGPLRSSRQVIRYDRLQRYPQCLYGVSLTSKCISVRVYYILLLVASPGKKSYNRLLRKKNGSA